MVVNRTPENPPGAWKVEALPYLEIGLVEGPDEYLFETVIHAHTLPDGRIVVVDAGAHAIRLLSDAGVHLESTGRRGEGPGEFGNVVHAERLADDTLVLMEFMGRVLFHEGDGTFVRTWRPPRWPPPARFLSSSTFLWREDETGSGSGRHSTRSALLLGDSAGPGPDTLAILTGREFVRVGANQAVLTVPFSQEDLVAVTLPDRRVVLSKAGFELLSLAAEGPDSLRILVSRKPRSVSGKEWARAVGSELARAPLDPSMRRATEEAFQSMKAPSEMPGYDRLVAGPDGQIWARVYLPPGEESTEQEWWGFSAGGRWLASVAVPSELWVLEIGRGHLLALWRDSMGVHRVRGYRLEGAPTQ